MPVFPWQKKVKEDGVEEFTLPDDLQKKIDDGAKAAAELPKITEMLTGLKTIMETQSADAKKKETEAAAAAARAAAAESQGTLEEQIEELILSGKTKQAIDLATKGQGDAILFVNARQLKTEVFSDVDKFKYYHGAIKEEVDKLLDGQTLQFRNNATNVENCYKTVLGAHAEELLEGKIKSRFAGSEGSRGTSTGDAGGTGTGEHAKPKITDDVRRAARLTGIDPEKYAEMLTEEGIGYA